MRGSSTLLMDVAIVPYLASVPVDALEDNPCISWQFSFPFSEASLLKPSCEPQWNSTKRFYFLESCFPLFRTAGLFFPNSVSLGAPAWARDFPDAIGLKIASVKQSCVCLDCVCDSSATVRKQYLETRGQKGTGSMRSCWQNRRMWYTVVLLQ